MAELEEIINEPSESEKRITQLSKKAKEQEEAKEAALKAQADAEAKAAESDRLVQFSEGFVDIVADNPAAKEHKDEIKAKVLAGMSLEDAKFAVLGKAGKLNQPKVEVMSTAGGSAATNLPAGGGGEKSISEMTQAERRAELESRADLVDILAPKIQR